MPSGVVRKSLILASSAALLLAPVLAHDLWLVPPSGAPVGEPLTVAATIGMDFPNGDHALTLDRFRARYLGPEGRPKHLQWKVDEASHRTLGTLTPEQPGAYLAYLETTPSSIQLEADDFNKYLLHDGLPHVLAQRYEAGEQDQAASERYIRYVKTLFSVGGSVEGPAPQYRAGQRLEIVPLRNPLLASPGETLDVRVYFDDTLLEGALLCWDLPGNGEKFAGCTWTNSGGVATVPIAAPGLLNLRLIHMTRPGHEEYEWESFWTSFTFEVTE